jgi:hypothetical protein
MAAAQPALPSSGSSPERVTLGVFVAGLHRLDFVAGTFAVDFWLSSVNDAKRAAPIETIDVNEISKREEPIGRILTDGRRWDQRRIHLLTLAAGFVAAIGAAAARYLAETNCEPHALRLDRRVLPPFAIVYLVTVGAMTVASVVGYRLPFIPA